jgi:hypothetical protein
MEQLFVIRYSKGLIFSPQEDFKKRNILDQIEMLVEIEKELADYRKQLLSDAWQNHQRSL